MPTVDAAPLRDYVARIFRATGAPEADAETVAAHLVESNLKGHDSHGVIRVPRYVGYIEGGRIVPGAELRIERPQAAATVVDGGWNFGQVVAQRTMAEAMESARSAGVGVAVAHRCGHVGRVGAYVEQAAAAGLIGIAMVNNHGGGQAMAPPGGLERRLSPNPIAMAVPHTEGRTPFVLDMTTSVVAVGKIRVAAARGEPVPEGWLLDADGQPTTDPAAFDADPPGALLPLGGPVAHKGFGLALAVEALAGALSPAGTSRPEGESGANGLFTMALDPEAFGGGEAFEASFGGLLDYVRATPLRAGASEILVPGQPEAAAQAERDAAGIPIEDATWTSIAETAAMLGVEPWNA